jgi:hypothetical protein
VGLLAIELLDDHQGHDDLVLVEAEQGGGIGEQDAGVEYVCGHVASRIELRTGLRRYTPGGSVPSNLDRDRQRPNLRVRRW